MHLSPTLTFPRILHPNITSALTLYKWFALETTGKVRMGSPLEEKPSAPSRHGFCVTLPRRHAVDDEVGRNDDRFVGGHRECPISLQRWWIIDRYQLCPHDLSQNGAASKTYSFPFWVLSFHLKLHMASFAEQNHKSYLSWTFRIIVYLKTVFFFNVVTYRDSPGWTGNRLDTKN